MEKANSFVIRQGQLSDAEVAVDLLMLSGGQLLTAIFGNGDTQLTREFLFDAWQKGQGQYGARSHWVAELNSLPVATVTLWQATMPFTFTQASMQSLHGFFGIEQATEIVYRSQAILKDVPPVKSNEVLLGHLAVLEENRHSGIGQAMVNRVIDQGRLVGKTRCGLDVDPDNASAIHFYQCLGFSVEQSHNKTFVRMSKGI